MMTDHEHFAARNRNQLAAQAPTSIALIPLGSTEQHGHHLPVGTDSDVVSTVAHRAANLIEPEITVLVLPTLPFGIAPHHLAYGGTISVASQTYIDLLCDFADSLFQGGFRRLIFLNGHGGNVAPTATAVNRIAYELELDIAVAAVSYWECAQTNLGQLELEAFPVPGHAGSFETACMLAINEGLVSLSDRPDNERAPQPLTLQDYSVGTVRLPGLWQKSDGRTDDARKASRELGERLLQAVCRSVGEYITTFHHMTKQYLPDDPSTQVQAFDPPAD